MSEYFKMAGSDWYRQRLFYALGFLMLPFALLIIRVFYLQVIEGKELRRLSVNNCIRIQRLVAARGLIFDRNERLLVDNRPSYNLNIILKDAFPVDETIAKLAQYTQIPLNELMESVEAGRHLPTYKPILLKMDIDRNTLAIVETHHYDLPGVSVNVRPLRQYLYPGSGAHLLGYMGEINAAELNKTSADEYRRGDFIGRFGVEKTYEAFLHGHQGGQQIEVDASGRTVRLLKTVKARAGHNLYLTIDQELQLTAESALGDRTGAVVAMDPNTGEILCMVSNPTFDQNAFVGGLSPEYWNSLINNPLRPLRNKAIQAEYPPASTFKIVTAMAALEERVVSNVTTFYCPGYLKFGDRTFRCWRASGHGHMNVVDALEQSCDVYFYHVSQKLGVDRIAKYAQAFGLGRPTGVKLSNESKGLIPSSKWKRARYGQPWHRGETLSVAIGQGYDLTTPMQLLVMTAAVANGGKILEPTLLHKVQSANNQPVDFDKGRTLGTLQVRRSTLETVKRGIWQVVQGKRGTARGIKIKGIEIVGKTGTAQVVGRKKNERFKDSEIPDQFKAHALFVAYAPAESPKIAVAIVVENGEHGSTAAAPVAGEVIRKYLGVVGDDTQSISFNRRQ